MLLMMSESMYDLIYKYSPAFREMIKREQDELINGTGTVEPRGLFNNENTDTTT